MVEVLFQTFSIIIGHMIKNENFTFSIFIMLPSINWQKISEKLFEYGELF